MPVSLKESRAATEMAKVLYSFLPASGARSWKGHITFQTVANDVGVGEFWQGGSKEPAIAALLERTLEYRRDLFEKLILTIVKEGLKYRKKKNDPISEDETKTLNGLILDVGFKFPALWDSSFLASLRSDGHERASKIVEREMAAQEAQISKHSEFNVKRASEITDDIVQAKANAAAVWCQHATNHAKECDGKPWAYLLIPHDQISEQMTLSGMAARFTYRTKGDVTSG